MSQDLDKLRHAAQTFLAANDVRMLVKLVRKYPEAARLPLDNGESLLVRSLEDASNAWPILMAYMQGGGQIDGASPTRGEASRCWLDTLLHGSSSAKRGPGHYQSIIMAMTLLHESGCTAEREIKSGRCLATALDLDISALADPTEGAFLLALEMKSAVGKNELNPAYIAACTYLGDASACESLLRMMKERGIPIDQEIDMGMKPIHYAIGRKKTNFIIGLSRNGVYLGDHIKMIRECGFPAEDLAVLEAEWMDADIRIEKGKGARANEGTASSVRPMIPRKGF